MNNKIRIVISLLACFGLLGACSKWDQGPVNAGAERGDPVVIFDPGLTKLNLKTDKNVQAVISFMLIKSEDGKNGATVQPFGRAVLLEKPVNYDPRVIIGDYSGDVAKKLYPDAYKVSDEEIAKMNARDRVGLKQKALNPSVPPDVKFSKSLKRLNLKFIFDDEVAKNFEAYRFSEQFPIPVNYEYRLTDKDVLELRAEPAIYEENFFANNLSKFTTVIPIKGVQDLENEALDKDGKVTISKERRTNVFSIAGSGEGFEVPPQFFYSDTESDLIDPGLMGGKLEVDMKQGISLKWLPIYKDEEEDGKKVADITKTYMDVRLIPVNTQFNPAANKSGRGPFLDDRSVMMDFVDSGSATIKGEDLKPLGLDKGPVLVEFWMIRTKPTIFSMPSEGDKKSESVGVILCSIASKSQVTLTKKAEEAGQGKK